MSGLAHLLEREQLSTVLIGLVPQHVAAMKPPRALLVPFELGRPLGEPGTPTQQQAVLSACLALLDRAGSGPQSEWFEAPAAEKRSADPDAGEGWACPVAFPVPAADDSLESRVQAEVELLMPWFERAVEARGHSTTGVSGMSVSDAARWLCTLLETGKADPPGDLALADAFKLAAEDLKAFYLEAATAQPGAGSAELATWFWQDTAAAELLWALRLAFKDDDSDPALRAYASFTTVPAAEVARRKAQR